MKLITVVLLGFVNIVMFTGCGIADLNNAPVANAGADQNVETNTLVTLDGSASNDTDGDLITYLWKIESKPEASMISAITDNTSIMPTFTPDVDGVYEISLTVNDKKLDSSADIVVITAATGNVKPVAHAGADQNVETNTLVTLDASLSSDADMDTLNYIWAILSVPIESAVTALSSSTVVNPSFIPDVEGEYVFSLVVDDQMLSSAEDTVTISATKANVLPVANAGQDRNEITGALVVLDGSASFDSDGEINSYTWSAVSTPDGTIPVLLDSTTESPSFIPLAEGEYQFSLTVNDGFDNSEIDAVVITAYPSVSQHAIELESMFMALKGNELTSDEPTIFKIEGGLIPISGEITVLGAASCIPEDPYMMPLDSAGIFPPSTIYGCDNNISVMHVISENNTSVKFTWTISDFFGDLEGKVSSTAMQGYATASDVQVEVEVMLNNIGDGLFLYGSVGETDITYAKASIVVDNALVQTSISLIEQSLIDYYSDNILEYVVQATTEYTDSRSPFMLD